MAESRQLQFPPESAEANKHATRSVAQVTHIDAYLSRCQLFREDDVARAAELLAWTIGSARLCG